MSDTAAAPNSEQPTRGRAAQPGDAPAAGTAAVPGPPQPDAHAASAGVATDAADETETEARIAAAAANVKRNLKLTPMPPGIELDGPEPGDRAARLVWRAARGVHAADARLQGARREFSDRKAEYLDGLAAKEKRATHAAAEDLRDAGISADTMQEIARLIAAGRREDAAKLLLQAGARP